MTLPPHTTPVPRPVFMPGVSHQGEAPQDNTKSSPIPITNGSKGHGHETTNGTLSTLSRPSFDLPRLRLRIDDIAHRGSTVFLNSINAATVLQEATRAVLNHLYTSPNSRYPAPIVRSTTVILRPMDGVAHTIGSDLDPEQHKEIHFSLGYIASLSPPSSQIAPTPTASDSPSPSSPSSPYARARHEIIGVLTHELVHCHQYNGLSTCPGGLIEGIADFVRLRADLAPPHWTREPAADGDTRWDRGYQNTAYFLDYLDDHYRGSSSSNGDDSTTEKNDNNNNTKGDLVRNLNRKLRNERYNESTFWEELVGKPVGVLWAEYQAWLKKQQMA